MWPRWLRAFSTAWVAWDSKKRNAFDLFWVVMVMVLGPFMLPIYMAKRPLLKGESRSKCIYWNVIQNFEKLFSCIFAIAAAAVVVENFTQDDNRDLSEVKKAEIKAGSIFGFFIALVLLGVEKIGFHFFKMAIEDKYSKR